MYRFNCGSHLSQLEIGKGFALVPQTLGPQMVEEKPGGENETAKRNALVGDLSYEGGSPGHQLTKKEEKLLNKKNENQSGS